jgi:hypothetical protein
MFGMSISSVSSIVTKKTASVVVADLAYLYYTFDQADVTGTNVLNRTSTFYDASLSTAGLLDSSNNISGTSDLSLNASAANQFVTINSSMDIGKSTGLSILLWVRYGADISNGTRIFDFGNNPASDNIEMFIDAIGIPMLSIYSGSTQYTYSFGYPVNNTLYRHLGITMSANGTFNYYIDGVLYKTTTANQYPTDIVRTKNFIGKSNNNALFYNGGIGEIRIYNNAVSSDVVLNNMNTNVRLYTNSSMIYNYGFKYSDLQNGKIKNLATGVYDASFLAPVTAFSINSGTGTTSKQIGITTGTQKYNQAGNPGIVTSRRNSNFLYNLPTAVSTGAAPAGQSGDWNYGIRLLNGFTTPATGGFTVNFFFYLLSNASVYDVPFFSFNNNNDKRLAFGANGTNNVSGAISAQFWLDILSAPYNPKLLYPAPLLTTNTVWYQYSLVVDYNAQSIKSYINLDSIVNTHDPYYDFSNITFASCTLMNDITYQGYDYNRPIRAFMDDFRVYNVPLKLHELRQLAQVPVIPGSRAYTLRPMTTAAPVNGNVAVYMDSAVSRIYLSAGVGNLYVGNIASSTWTQSTLAAGSSGQLENRNWRDIVCNGTGQYVVACAWTATINDPSGTVFYSSDYGNTYTQTASVIDTPYCFNLAMSNDGNYTYMTTWGVPTPSVSTNYGYGNLYTSLDKGVTWSKITDVSGAGITVGNPSWASIPAQVRCNSTGEYVSLGIIGFVNPPILLSNYGHQLMNTPVPQNFGQFNSNPVITNRASDNALIASVCTLGRGSGNNYGMLKAVYQIANKTATIQNCLNTPITGGIAPQTTSAYPWTGTRNVCMATDRTQIVVVDTAGLGNVFISTNGLSSAPWPETAAASGISCLGDVTNLSIPNVISQAPVPRSAWSGLCVNYTDHFAFANKTGTVYIYSWTL